MNKKIQKNKSLLVLSIVFAVLLAGSFAVNTVKADISFKELIAEKVAVVLGEKLSAELGLGEEIQLGISAQANRLTNGYWDTGHGYWVDGEVVINGTGQLAGTNTTTLNEVTLGSRFYVALDFTAGNTTTPGSLASLQNTGSTKICQIVEVDISTASSIGGSQGSGTPYLFGVGTSTDATSWTGATIIASSTVATATTMVLDNTENVGSYGRSSFIWTSSEYINAAFDAESTQTDASSTAYTSMTGGLYLHCTTR